MRVRVRQRAGDCHRNADALVDGQLFLAINALPKAFPVDVRHHVEWLAVHFAGVEQRQEVRMLEVRGDTNLREKAVDAEGGAELRVEELQGDGAAVAEVAREVHGRHTAAADLSLDDVPVRDRRGQFAGDGHEGAIRGRQSESNGVWGFNPAGMVCWSAFRAFGFIHQCAPAAPSWPVRRVRERERVPTPLATNSGSSMPNA